jgi:phosphoribosylanthranilate isomerase
MSLNSLALKVCGMTQRENIQAVLEAKPDWIGLIFWPKSKRYCPLTPEQWNAMDIGQTKSVGVFVDQPMEEVTQIAQTYQLNGLQLHGTESPEYLKTLKRKLPKTAIIKAFSIDQDFNWRLLLPYHECCDLFLFDTKGPLPGGNGTAFDWSILTEYPGTTPFLLSGGIHLGLIKNLLEWVNTPASTWCVGIDVNSGFEVSPGIKNPERIKQMSQQCKQL